MKRFMLLCLLAGCFEAPAGELSEADAGHVLEVDAGVTDAGSAAPPCGVPLGFHSPGTICEDSPECQGAAVAMVDRVGWVGCWGCYDGICSLCGHAGESQCFGGTCRRDLRHVDGGCE